MPSILTKKTQMKSYDLQDDDLRPIVEEPSDKFFYNVLSREEIIDMLRMYGIHQLQMVDLDTTTLVEWLYDLDEHRIMYD